MSDSSQLPVIIIGAGIGGLSAAIRLAASGQRVIIVEKNAQPGGKMSQFALDGFRWDTGPSVITMRHVFEDLFAAANRNLTDYIDLQPVDPLTRYFYPDGTVLDATSDLSKMARAIEQLDPADVEGYLTYLAYAARIHRITGPVFIYDHPPTPASFLRVSPIDWLKVDPFRTMDSAIKRFVRSPTLRQLLNRFATYAGGDPYQAPATLNVIAHVELTGGVWYPCGGIYTIAAGLTRLANELGVEIRTSCGAQAINLDEDGAVCGIALESGEIITTDAVLSNVDVTTIHKLLLPQTPAVAKRLAQLEQYKPSCSGFVMLLGVKGQRSQLAHHNILFSPDYPAEFRAIFHDHHPPDDPTIYIAITSKSDPDHAPIGSENWFVLVNAPPLSADYDWSANQAAYRDRILEILAQRGLDIREKIRTEHILTPADLEQQSAAWRGALYGPSPNSRWAAFRRPHNRSREVKELYFAGGTTHPGGGVPMVILSGKVASEMILKRRQQRI